MGRVPGMADRMIVKAHTAALRALSPVIDKAIVDSGLGESDVRYITIPVLSSECLPLLRRVMWYIDNCITQGITRATLDTVPYYQNNIMTKVFRIAQICCALGIRPLGRMMTIRLERRFYKGPTAVNGPNGTKKYVLYEDELECIFRKMGRDYPVRQLFITGIAKAWLDGKLDQHTRRRLRHGRHGGSTVANEVEAAMRAEWSRRVFCGATTPKLLSCY
ncbi:hypothetical protein OHC33_001327 [Knufia fluminis]|uniref:Uncharacterized protein n=2 Tax=Knufia TaxID=430999 RepID=A0AAN8ET16_9EURO|nr:hypothetical protein OHC33_001327 [Knufia fluminis]